MASRAQILTVLTLLGSSSAQYVYVQGQDGPETVTCDAGRPSRFVHPTATLTSTGRILTTFPTQTSRYAVSLSSELAKAYALPYASVSSLFADVSSTTWGNWVPAQSSVSSEPTSGDPYGDGAFSNLWNAANPTNFTRGIYSTTVVPTSVPTSELVYPPPSYFKPDGCLSFPKDFIFGVAGAAAQCEGAVADEGKSPSFPDMLATLLEIIGGSSSAALIGLSEGTIAPNYVTNEHYYLYKQDIERLASMGMEYYSFTIPWTRILPFALPGTPANSKALEHYDDVINFVLEKGMKPIVTMHHFDTPLQFYGGGQDYLYQLAATQANQTYGSIGYWAFQNSTFEDAYVHYASIIMSRYADRVPLWVTFNEPQIGTTDGPGVDHVLKAHARVYHFYKDQLKGTGKVTMKMGISPSLPLKATNQSHIEASEYFNDMYITTWLNPLGPGLDYPNAFKHTVPDYVPLSVADLAYLRGTLDLIAFDAYSVPIIEPVVSDLDACATDTNHTSNPYRRFPTCVAASSLTATGWGEGVPSQGMVTFDFPQGIRWQLNYLWQRYGMPLIVSEFGLIGAPPTQGRLQDYRYNTPQSEYLVSYLNEMLKAIWEDGVDLVGAIVWTWADNWEWGAFDTGFGMQYVNRTTQERSYKRSFFDVIDFVKGPREDARHAWVGW